MKLLEVHAPQFKETLTMNDLRFLKNKIQFYDRKELLKTKSKKMTITKEFPYEMDYLDFFIIQ